MPDPACGEPDDDASGPLSTKELVIAISVPLVAVVVVLTVALVLTLLCCTHYRKTGGKRIAYGGKFMDEALAFLHRTGPTSLKLTSVVHLCAHNYIMDNIALRLRQPEPIVSQATSS